jgi:glucan biosynthesis protein C
MSTVRYHELDFARAILMILGVFFHASLIYHPSSMWTVSHLESHSVFSYFSIFSSSFRMPAFYVIAGFFFLLIIEKKGVVNGIKNRLISLSIPMFFIGFTLNFIPNALSDNYVFPDNTYEYISSGDWLRHTWFLGNLICYCLVCSFFIKIKIFSKLWNKIFSWKLISVFIFFIPIVIVIVKDQTWRLTGYDNHFFITSKELLILFPYFLLGIFVFSKKEVLLDYITTPITFFLLIMALFLACITQVLSGIAPWALIIKHYQILFLCFGMICFLCLLSAKFDRFFIRNISDASYTIYLLHSPIIIVVYYFGFKHSDINIFLQYAMICSFTLFCSYFFHTKVVKRFALIELLLNGKQIPATLGN